MLLSCTARGEPFSARAEVGRARDAATAEGCFTLVNARAPGGAPTTLVVRDGRVAEGDCARRVDAEGAFVAPAFVDSHVHLAYHPVHAALAAGGVAAAVDLAAPLASLDAPSGPLRVLSAGPMITAPGGYPTQSWGYDGYGLECEGSECAAAVDRLAARGVRVIKVPLTGERQLDDATLAAVVERAHGHGLKVAVHALTEDAARRAALAGADVLAHTPTEPLSDETLARWAERAVISTLGAFGGASRENLARLHAAGATVLYGTDLGNTRDARIDPREIAALREVGLDGAAILAAGTRAPAAFWGMDDLGALEPGRAASFLLLDADPLLAPETLSTPRAVYLDGALIR